MGLHALVNKLVYTWNAVLNTCQVSTERVYVYDGWNLVAELNGVNAPQRTFMWGLDLSGTLQGAGGVGGLLAINSRVTPAGTYFVSHDGRGNVTQLTSGTDGTTVAQYSYGPFGELIRKPHPGSTYASVNPFLFSTKFWDAETDLLYYGYRYYNPGTGRWLSRDPIEEAGGNNLNGFLSNNPISKYDFLGLEDPTHSECLGHSCAVSGEGLHFCGPATPVPPKHPNDLPGMLRPPVYNPPDLGKPCCEKPAVVKIAKRVDLPPITNKRGVSETIRMRLDLKIEGVYKNLEIYWTACWRHNNAGVIPESANLFGWDFTITAQNRGHFEPGVTSARVNFLSCENGTWTAKFLKLGGGYFCEGHKWDLKYTVYKK